MYNNSLIEKVGLQFISHWNRVARPVSSWSIWFHIPLLDQSTLVFLFQFRKNILYTVLTLWNGCGHNCWSSRNRTRRWLTCCRSSSSCRALSSRTIRRRFWSSWCWPWRSCWWWSLGCCAVSWWFWSFYKLTEVFLCYLRKKIPYFLIQAIACQPLCSVRLHQRIQLNNE